MSIMSLSKAKEKIFFKFHLILSTFSLNLKIPFILDLTFSNLQGDRLPELKNKKAALCFAKRQHSKKKANTII